MTQTMQVEAGTNGMPVVNGLSVQGDSSGTEGSSFAQLLAIAQNLPHANGLEPEVSVPANTPPEQQQSPTVGEMEQMAALLGLPSVVGAMPFAQPTSLPAAHDADTAPRLSVQAVALAQTATDVPLPPIHLQAEPAIAQTETGTDDTTVHLTPLAASDGDTPLAAHETSRMAVPAPSVPAMPPVTAPFSLNGIAPEPTVDQAQAAAAAAPAPEAQAETQNVTEKSHAPSELSPSAAAHTPAAAPAPTSNAGQPQNGERYERQNAAGITPRSVRSQTRKAAAFEVASKTPPSRSMGALPHHTQGVEMTSAAHRTQEPAAPSTEVSPLEVVQQVARQIETMTSHRRTSSVTLQLEPEHLGRLRVTISVSEGAIHTHIVADNHAVRQMLESNSGLLQQALQERGLQLGALQVSVQGDGRQFLAHQPHPPQARGWFEAEARLNTVEAPFGQTTPGGINLLA